MEEPTDPTRNEITSWKEFIGELIQPARFPKFPELTSTGVWKPWIAETPSQQSQSSSVEQPTSVPSRFRRLVSRDRQYCRPLRFKPLPEGHVRLLDLRHAKMENEVLVGFHLITVPLSKAPTYEAISYCWGSTHLCTGIFVSSRRHKDQVYRVTENLATCLHSLLVSHQSDTERPRYIWVDQICINQEHVVERNAQVRRMADIYKSAARVIVWLGQESDFSMEDNDLDMLPDLHATWRSKRIIEWFSEWAIFARPWFHRLWVFQEAVFARNVSVLLGTSFWDWGTLTSRRDVLHEFRDDYLLGKVDRNYYAATSTMQSWMLAWIEETALDLATNENIDLASLIWRLNSQQCQDPKDTMFSLVGLAGTNLPANFVDYSQPVAVLNQSFTRHLIQQRGHLEPITYSNPEFLGLGPSWVPLWDQELRRGIGAYVPNASASLLREWKPIEPMVEDQLVVSGKEVDSVASEILSFAASLDRFFMEKRFASVLREPFHDAWSQLSRLHQERDQQKSAEDAASAPASPIASCSEPPASFFKDFFRTIFLHEEEETDLETLIRIPNETETLTRLEKLLNWSVYPYSTLLLLKRGRIGFVKEISHKPEPGDSVAILHGHDIPCILRKAKNGEGWLFVTEIYIHDIMHGEGMCNQSR